MKKSYKIIRIAPVSGFCVKEGARKELKVILNDYKAVAPLGKKRLCKWHGKDGIQVYSHGSIVKFRIVEEI